MSIVSRMVMIIIVVVGMGYFGDWLSTKMTLEQAVRALYAGFFILVGAVLLHIFTSSTRDKEKR